MLGTPSNGPGVSAWPAAQPHCKLLGQGFLAGILQQTAGVLQAGLLVVTRDLVDRWLGHWRS